MFDEWDEQKARAAITTPDWLTTNQRLFDGDHWLDSLGWAGPRPALDEIARVVATGGYLLLSTVGEQFPALMLGTPQPDGQERAAIDQSYAHYHYYSTAGLSDELAARGLRVLGSASYIDAAQVRRLNQLRRAPLGLALVPWMFRLHAPPDRGAGLAVIAQRPA